MSTIDPFAILRQRVSEREFANAIVDAARLLGYRCYHSWISVRSDPGFPDLVLVRPPSGDQGGRVVFAELKTEHGQLTAPQQRWLRTLAAAGAEAYVWRPSDLERALQILAAEAAPYPPTARAAGTTPAGRSS